VRSFAGCRSRKTVVPFGQDAAQLVAQDEQILDAPIESVEPLVDQLTNLQAWCAASVAKRQHALEIGKREPDDQRALDQ
jgi:hypothetical protein